MPKARGRFPTEVVFQGGGGRVFRGELSRRKCFGMEFSCSRPTPYNSNYNLLSVSLKKAFPSLLPSLPPRIRSTWILSLERIFLFNDALNIFYLRLYGVRHMVKDHYDSEKGNPLPPHSLLLSVNSKGSFICTIPQTG